MDQELLKLLTKIKILGKKAMGVEVDIMRLSGDRPYATEVLKRLSSSDNEELVMSAIEFMGKLGLLDKQTPATETASTGDSATSRYTGRLR